MVTENILTLLMAERDRLNRAIAALQGIGSRGRRPRKSKSAAAAKAPAARRRRRVRTAAQRKAQSERMKAFWAKRKKQA